MIEIRDEGTEFVTVFGTVSSTSGETLPGAHVYRIDAAGLPEGTVTGPDGRFSDAVPDGAELYASYIGHGTQVKVVHGPGTINFELVPGVDIDEVEIFPDPANESGVAEVSILVALGLLSALGTESKGDGKF